MTKPRFFWYELMTSDQDAAIDFYGKVVGWNAAAQPQQTPDGMRYTILSAGDRGMGGVLQINDEMRANGARPTWLGYVHVPDTDAAAKSIAGAGGTVHMEPADIPGIGRFAMVADPGGAMFYVMTPSPRPDEPPPPEPDTPGLIGWHELFAGNGQEAAFAFYSGQFGWETVEEMDMGTMGKYRVFGADGVQIGGMMDKPTDMPVSAWGFYVNIDGIDAAIERITANGGQILKEPHEVPGGSWIVHAMDPQGAAFALLSPTR